MSTATFAGAGFGATVTTSFFKLASKSLPGNTSWAVTATVTTLVHGQSDERIRDLDCELRNGGGFIGGASDRRVIPSDDLIRRSLTVTGGAFIPAGGGEVALFCRSSAFPAETVEGAQIMLIQIDGFS